MNTRRGGQADVKPLTAAGLGLLVLGAGVATHQALNVAGLLRAPPTTDAPPDWAILDEGWERLLAWGDWYLARRDYRWAREIYLAAFARARREGSVDGMITVAEAFARLEDREMVRKTLAAAKMAAAEPEMRADVHAAEARLLPGLRSSDDVLDQE
jgi:hypothetical protein